MNINNRPQDEQKSYILDGRAEITIGATTSTVNTGEMLIMPARIPHALHAENKFKMLLVMIRGE